MDKFRFSIGDTIVFFGYLRQEDIEKIPFFGIVTGTTPTGIAIIEWKEKIHYRPLKESFDVHNQRAICNNETKEYRLIRKGEIRKNKRKPKKIKIGDIVEILNGPKKGETGIVVKHSDDTYWHQVYLQNDMNFVWRETTEIRKL